MYLKNVYSVMTVACPKCKGLFQIGNLWFLDDKLVCFNCLESTLRDRDKDTDTQPSD